MRSVGLLLVALAILLPVALPVLAAALPTEDATSVCAAPLGNAADSLRLAPVAWTPAVPAPLLLGTDASASPAPGEARSLPSPAPCAVETPRLL